MAFSSANLSLSEDQFQCSICLDVFTDPVTTPCGHNFCKTCITGYWDSSDHCQCPMCKNAFERRPDLKVNTLFSEVITHVKKLASVKDETKPLEQSPVAESGVVPCDFCTEKKVNALKSCLVCLASYCETHLEHHKILASFKRHKLIDPVENLEDRVCKKHERPLEMFCKNDKMCVCLFCLENDHKTHTTVSIEEECEERKVELGKTEAQVQQMIQERQQKVQEIRNSVKVSERNTEKEIADTVQVFTSVIRSIERSQAEIIEEAEKKQKAIEKQAEETIKELEQEMDELQTRCSELKILSHTEDQLHLLKTSPSLCTLPTTKNLSGIKVQGDTRAETLCRVVSDMEKTLTKELEKIKHQRIKHYAVDEGKIKHQRIKHYAVDVTLDPDTAHRLLILSDDRKQVRRGGTIHNLPNNPKRFVSRPCVLAKEGFNSGRFYYEVEVTGGTNWNVGVMKESVDRKSGVSCCPESGVWSVRLFRDKYSADDDRKVSLSLKEKLQTVGVFVDYENREVSFYNAETGSSIYSFTNCRFSDKLYPYFYKVDRNPLIIRSVSKTN